MKTPNIARCLALTLPLWAAVPGWPTAALASDDPEVSAAMLALEGPMVTTVEGQALLEFRLRPAYVAVEIDLKVDGEWTATGGDVVDVIAADSPISTVVSRFQPGPGDEQRVRFKVHGSPTWGPWSAWTTGRVSHTAAVPGAGQLRVDEFEASTRQVGSGTPVIGGHGYIKIKKLDSGG